MLTDFSHGSGALRGIRLKLWFEKDTKWKPVDRLDQLRALVLCLKVRWVELWQLLRLRQHQLYQREPIRPQLLSLRHLWTHQDWQIIFLILWVEWELTQEVKGFHLEWFHRLFLIRHLEDLFRLVGLILSFNDKMFLFLQLLRFLDVRGFLKVHLMVHHLWEMSLCSLGTTVSLLEMTSLDHSQQRQWGCQQLCLQEQIHMELGSLEELLVEREDQYMGLVQWDHHLVCRNNLHSSNKYHCSNNKFLSSFLNNFLRRHRCLWNKSCSSRPSC